MNAHYWRDIATSGSIKDPRTEDFPEASPLFLVGFLCMYWYTVKHFGPKLMENRKPFEIKNLLLIYNFVQILVNVFFIVKHHDLYTTIFDACIPIDYSRSERGLTLIAGVRHFFWLKLFDCLETVFFVLRKSYRQVSFLHVYHHNGMVFGVWIALRYYGGGHSTTVGALNVIVHAVMFFYYLLTCIDSSWKTSVTFKRSLTQMQMHHDLYTTIFDACIPIDYSRSERGLTLIAGVRHFFWLKLFDCLETVFFVLRKSYRQVSFLHVYHHNGMVFGVWIALRYYGGGHSTTVGALNVIVHAVMFFYYLLTCIDSSWKTSVTFKRSLTQMQMVQFLFIMFSFGRVLLSPDCTYPKLPCYLMFIQTTFMFTLFFDFYRKNYISKGKKE